MGARPNEILLNAKRIRSVAEAGTIHLNVRKHLSYIVARFGDRYAFDPVDRIDIRIARVAVFANPLARSSRPRIVPSETEHVGTAEVVQPVGDIGRGYHHIILGVREQPRDLAFDLVVVADVTGRNRHDLQQTLGTGA